jgi:hypothetical protein
MVDTDTFLTTLYVMVDDFCKERVVQEVRPGPRASLSTSEVVTLTIYGQWSHFRSERRFYRYAQHHLRSAFPTLPDRSQFNRLMRQDGDVIVAFLLYLSDLMDAQHCLYEALDGTGVATRDVKRRGAGWLAGMSDIGWSNHLGWYEGLYLLIAVNPSGVITGFGFAPASTKDQSLAETFFALRQQPNPRLPSAGRPAQNAYVADKGFEGQKLHLHWRHDYGANLICPPKKSARQPWPKPLRRWLASLRQIVETVNDKLHNTFRLNAERPHDLTGFQARLAAKVALHNFCTWLNRQLGRSPLAFADLLDW